MIIGHIEGFTRELGKPEDWDNERDGKCASLAIRDCADLQGNQLMVSAWLPTPDELKRLNEGESVILIVVGVNHPVVALNVGPIEFT